MVKRPSYHLLSTKTEYTPCWVLMARFGFRWAPCAKEVALLRHFPFGFFFVALWDTTVILFQYKNQTQVLGLGVSACLLSHPTVYLFESFLFHHVC